MIIGNPDDRWHMFVNKQECYHFFMLSNCCIMLKKLHQLKKKKIYHILFWKIYSIEPHSLKHVRLFFNEIIEYNIQSEENAKLKKNVEFKII